MKFSIALASFLAVGASAFVNPHGARRTTVAVQNDLWDEPPEGEKKEMSKALPFLPRPELLDGTLPGDVGFE